jgi:hypothetical protein
VGGSGCGGLRRGGHGSLGWCGWNHRADLRRLPIRPTEYPK